MFFFIETRYVNVSSYVFFFETRHVFIETRYVNVSYVFFSNRVICFFLYVETRCVFFL